MSPSTTGGQAGKNYGYEVLPVGSRPAFSSHWSAKVQASGSDEDGCFAHSEGLFLLEEGRLGWVLKFGAKNS